MCDLKRAAGKQGGQVSTGVRKWRALGSNQSRKSYDCSSSRASSNIPNIKYKY